MNILPWIIFIFKLTLSPTANMHFIKYALSSLAQITYPLSGIVAPSIQSLISFNFPSSITNSTVSQSFEFPGEVFPNAGVKITGVK